MTLPCITCRIVLAFIVLSAALLAGMGGYSYFAARQSLFDGQVSSHHSIAIEKLAQIDAIIEDASDDVQAIAAQPDLADKAAALSAAAPGSAQARAAHAALVRALTRNFPGPRDAYLELFAIDPASGTVMASTDPAQEGKSKRGDPYFDHGKAGLFVQEPYFSADLGGPEMRVAAPLRAFDGRTAAVFVARLRLSEVQAVIHRLSGGDAFLVNRAGDFIIKPRFPREPIAPRPTVGAADVRRCAAGQDGWIRTSGNRGTPVVAVCHWDARRGFGLFIEIDRAELYAPASAFLGRIVLIASVMLVLAVGPILFLARTITAPLGALRDQVRHFGEFEGDEPLQGVKGDEIAALANAFSRTAARVVERTSQLAAANAALSAMAMVDGLTGIANWRRFDEVLLKEWARARRHSQPISLIMADIDHFKKYNDRFGHLAGDDCLRRIAQAIDGSVRRPGDQAARYGGEEFAAILPNTDAAGAAALGEDIRANVKALAMADGGGGIVTISVGVATEIPGKTAKPEDLIGAADRALFRAKATGRDRVVSAPGAADRA